MEVLTINGGSSSIKFALFQTGEPTVRLRSGNIERVGLPDGPSQSAAIGELVDQLKGGGELKPAGIGHRVVHGGPKYLEPTRITPELVKQLRSISPFDQEHLPFEISLIEECGRRFPEIAQVACFDTGFHRNMPAVAKRLAIPRKYEAQGIHRYGFHGLSYAYLMEELGRLGAASGRIVLAHLGNGASMAAVRDGRSIDTSMAFTPCAGLPMSTRSGDIDPGLVYYLSRTEGMTPQQFDKMVNHQSGLLGISETSSDVRDLCKNRAADPRAGEAIDLFCYQARKWLGGFVAVLGGLDTLVFSGGIGEHSAEIRAGICAGLECFGINLDEAKNRDQEPVISTPGKPVTVRVIKTDEEIMIAKETMKVLA